MSVPLDLARNDDNDDMTEKKKTIALLFLFSLLVLLTIIQVQSNALSLSFRLTNTLSKTASRSLLLSNDIARNFPVWRWLIR